MKKDNLPNAKLLPAIEELSSNSVGGTDMKKNRSQALKLIREGKNSDEAKLAKGYLRVTNGKTSVLAHPDNIEAYKEKGFKITQVGRR